MKPCKERSGENNCQHPQESFSKHNCEPAMSQNNQTKCKLNYETKSGTDIGSNHHREKVHNAHQTNGSSLDSVTNSKTQSDDSAVTTKHNEATLKHRVETSYKGPHCVGSPQYSEVCSMRHHSGDSLESLQKPSHKRKTVMIAMDGSGHSFYAFDWYMSQMHTPDTEVIVAHSSLHHSKPFSHVQNLMPSVITSDPSSMSRIIQQEEEEVNKIVSQIKGKLTQAGVRGKLLRLNGDPGAAIIQAAQENGVHCIVTGSRGLGTVRRTLIGSVSDYILHHSHCPVLVCRHKDL